jgi:hypothetical protein
MLSLGLRGHCVGTIVGEEIICFCWIEGVEAAVVVVVFFASFEHIVKMMNFAI